MTLKIFPFTYFWSCLYLLSPLSIIKLTRIAVKRDGIDSRVSHRYIFIYIYRYTVSLVLISLLPSDVPTILSVLSEWHRSVPGPHWVVNGRTPWKCFPSICSGTSRSAVCWPSSPWVESLKEELISGSDISVLNCRV